MRTWRLAVPVLALVVAAPGAVAQTPCPGCGPACTASQVSGDWIRETRAPTSAFSGLSVRDAREKARAEGRVLLIDSTASWCPPCRQMEATTWRAPALIDWVARNAVAVSVDVDELPDVAEHFGIRSMPTMILSRDGVELDRVTGLKSDGELLAWMELTRTHDRLDLPLADADEARRVHYRGVPDDANEDVFLRLVTTNGALADGRFDDALRDAEWLWVHGEKYSESFDVLRNSVLVGTMTVLAQKHPPARRSFGRFLEAAQQEIDDDHVGEAIWTDFVALCTVLGQPQQVTAWYEQHCDADGSIDGGRYRNCRWIADSLYDQCVRERRWAEAGKVYRFPGARAGRLAATHHMKTSTSVPGLAVLSDVSKLAGRTEPVDRELRENLAGLSATLVAADRPDDARAVADQLLAELPDRESRKALVRWALDRARPLPDHVRWYAEALEQGADVEAMGAELEAAMAQPAVTMPER